MSSESESEVPVEAPATSLVSRIVRLIWEHPYVVGLLFAGTLGGAGVSVILPMDDISMLRRVLGGAVAGFYFVLLPLGFRLLR